MREGGGGRKRRKGEGGREKKEGKNGEGGREKEWSKRNKNNITILTYVTAEKFFEWY